MADGLNSAVTLAAVTIMRVVALCASFLAAAPVHAQLRGHGGPVRTVAVASDGDTVLSGSFDQSAIRWSLSANAAKQVLRFHDGAVNAVAFLPDGRAVTAGEEGRIAIWHGEAEKPERVLDGHRGPVVALAIAPDGQSLASASWDRTVRLWPLIGGSPRIFEGHQQNVNGVAFSPDGHAVVSASYDATLRIWPLTGPQAPVIVTLPTPLNAVAIAPDGEIAVGASDGMVRFFSATGEARGEVEAATTPVTALAASGDGALLAAAGIRGSVAIIDRHVRRVVRTLVGPGLPVWSVAFAPDHRSLLTGGTDRMVRRWDALTGDPIGTMVATSAPDPLTAFAGDRGAEVFRACVACHTLRPDEGQRAGPTLHRIFGRRIASQPGYNYSEALRRMDIVWTPETVSKLFEVGPNTYTPGTKMPDQRIGSAEDRAALMQFLERAANH